MCRKPVGLKDFRHSWVVNAWQLGYTKWHWLNQSLRLHTKISKSLERCLCKVIGIFFSFCCRHFLNSLQPCPCLASALDAVAFCWRFILLSRVSPWTFWLWSLHLTSRFRKGLWAFGPLGFQPQFDRTPGGHRRKLKVGGRWRHWSFSFQLTASQAHHGQRWLGSGIPADSRGGRGQEMRCKEHTRSNDNKATQKKCPEMPNLITPWHMLRRLFGFSSQKMRLTGFGPWASKTNLWNSPCRCLRGRRCRCLCGWRPRPGEISRRPGKVWDRFQMVYPWYHHWNEDSRTSHT